MISQVCVAHDSRISYVLIPFAFGDAFVYLTFSASVPV
jgi:hypothetical protein